MKKITIGGTMCRVDCMSNGTKANLPDGTLIDDQISCMAVCVVTGGQLITGRQLLPDETGPNPLLLPATAMITVGTLEATRTCHTRTNHLLEEGQGKKDKRKKKLNTFVVR